jgi:protein TIF31
MTDESATAVEPDNPLSFDGVEDATTGITAEEPVKPSPGEQILKHLIILPPLQKANSLPENINELQDAVPLPPIRAEEPVSSIRNALGEVCGFSHLTSYRFMLEDPPTRHTTDLKKKSSPHLSQASPYTGPHSVISFPVAVRSLEDKTTKSPQAPEIRQVVLDDYGDLTAYLDQGLKDGSAFRIVLERYDALSIRNHVIRLRLLLEGSAPHNDTLDDGSGSEYGDHQEQNENDKSKEDGEAHEEPAKEEKTDESKDSKPKDSKLEGKALPVFHDGQPLSPDMNDLKHFYYYACGEDPESFLGDWSSSDPARRENGSKSKKKNKKKKDSKGQASNDDTDDNEHDEMSKMELKELIPQLNVLEEKIRVSCSITFSGFHPPPPFRRLLGDIAYFEVSLPDGEIVHVTGTPMGFFINQSKSTGDNKHFDPSPATKPCYSHELLDCLLQYSEAMQESWVEAVNASKRRSELMSKINEDGPFFSYFRVATRGDFAGYTKPSVASASEGIDSLIQNPSWLVPIPRVEIESPYSWNRNVSHPYNTNRTEEDLSSSFGVDVRSGALRDWNEELQVAREMPMDSLAERIERAR